MMPCKTSRNAKPWVVFQGLCFSEIDTLNWCKVSGSPYIYETLNVSTFSSLYKWNYRVSRRYASIICISFNILNVFNRTCLNFYPGTSLCSIGTWSCMGGEGVRLISAPTSLTRLHFRHFTSASALVRSHYGRGKGLEEGPPSCISNTELQDPTAESIEAGNPSLSKFSYKVKEHHFDRR